MSKFIVAAKKFVRDEEGASMVEYGLLVALVSVIAILALTFLGNEVGQTFNASAMELDAAQGATQVPAGTGANP